MIGNRTKIEIRFAGEGGQGLLSAATILGESLTLDTDLYVCQSQNYGPESRGGLSYSDLIISEGEIDFPKVKRPDILVCMSNEAYLKFKTQVESKAIFLLLIDPDLVTAAPYTLQGGGRLIRVPAAALSEQIFGSRIGANSVLLGTLHAVLSLGSRDALESVLRKTWPGLAGKNVQAFRKGIAMAERVEPL